MVIVSTLLQAHRAWSCNPTPRTYGLFVASVARVSEEMHSRGIQDVYHSDAGVSVPRGLREIMEFLKRREESGFVAA